jgi:hypothetical protein
MVIILCPNLYSDDFSNNYSGEIEDFVQDFDGIWRCDNTAADDSLDSYLAISKVSADVYFILYVNPYWEYRYDYATYGKLNKDGEIEIKTDEYDFYIELHNYGGSVTHYITRDDYHPATFKKVQNKATMEIREGIPEISPEDFYDFIMSQTEE